jgi:diguanylate cyclase (GGDEF)-like protein
MSDHDLISIIDDDGPPTHANTPWRILVVDDDEEVHAVTRIALSDFSFRDRKLRIDSCFTAREAFDVLSRNDDIACVLLDVVMEDELAGLVLVRRIREELRNQRIRIILRTGQPGYAPETEVIRSYDINDYKAKTELTANRLFSAVITALRSFEQITTIEDHMRGLEMVIRASADLFSKRQVRDFAIGVLTQLAAHLGVPPEGVLCTSMARDELIVVAGAGRYSGFIDKPMRLLDDPVAQNSVTQALQTRSSIHCQDGSAFYLESATGQPGVVFVAGHCPPIDDKKQLLTLFCMNIALGFETAQLFEQVQTAAYVDTLTRLPNRAGFILALNRLPPSRQVLVAVVNIDQFHVITGRLGFHVGDFLLQAVAQRLTTVFPNAVAVARLSSDQFALALALDGAQHVGERIDEAFDVPVTFAGITTTLGVTGGFVTSTSAGTCDGETLLRQATRATKEAKSTARGKLLAYDRTLDGQDGEQLVLMSDLRHALRTDEIVLHYQPKIDLMTGAPAGVEALVRWQSSRNGLLFPASFIPVAEVSGLILPLGQKILEMALRQHLTWQGMGLTIPMAVNVSAIQIQQSDFTTIIADILNRVPVAPERIEIEITETSLMVDSDRVFSHLAFLRDRGFSLALDDFGTGYSSLAHLHLLPLTTLKIDQRFVSTVNAPGRSAILIGATIGVARSMGLSVVAEGVETPEQAATLREMGVDQAQGYLFARPMPAANLVDWWRAGSVVKED